GIQGTRPRHPGQCAAHADAPHPELSELLHRREIAPNQYVHGLWCHGVHDLLYLRQLAQARRVETIGAGLAECDEPLDGFVEIRTTSNEALAARGEYDAGPRE